MTRFILFLFGENNVQVGDEEKTGNSELSAFIFIFSWFLYNKRFLRSCVRYKCFLSLDFSHRIHVGGHGTHIYFLYKEILLLDNATKVEKREHIQYFICNFYTFFLYRYKGTPEENSYLFQISPCCTQSTYICGCVCVKFKQIEFLMQFELESILDWSGNFQGFVNEE